MLAALYTTKKSLKAAKGQSLRFYETSLYGREYPEDGTGVVYVVGPSAYTRKWFAQVTLKEGVITKVT